MSVKSHTKSLINLIILFVSPLFERKWYIQQHPDIDFSHMLPEKHYLTSPWNDDNNPSPEFSNELYNASNRAFGCPLIHYELHGYQNNSINERGVRRKMLLRPLRHLIHFAAQLYYPYEKSMYYAHRLARFISRQIGRLVYAKTIRNNQDKRILVILHLFYMNSWKEIVEYLKNLDSYRYDLCVTYIEGHFTQAILDRVQRSHPNVRLLCCKNNGFDIGPYLEVLKYYDLSQYDYVYKLHSKGTNRRLIYSCYQLYKKRDWFLYLYEGILGAFNVHRAIQALSMDDTIGLIAAENLIICDPKHKRTLTYRWMQYLGIEVPENEYKFVAGTCFIARAKPHNMIKRLNLNLDSFGPTARGEFSLAHGLERIICIDIQDQGYKTLGLPACRLRYCLRNSKVDYYRNTSALRMLDDKRFHLDEGAFYFALEPNRIESWEIVDMPLGDIRRNWNNNLYKLQDCSAYKYLCGDFEAYNKYCELHGAKNNLPNMSIDRYDTLIKSIKENGYNNQNIIVVEDGTDVVIDGLHRSCILLYLYGPEYIVKVLRIKTC